ncbi:MAG TPA: ArsR family transcriptional regulator [Anaerolineales bacterium]|nr:ArsR family transcriptional regulator [Anaerolineales bacterium]
MQFTRQQILDYLQTNRAATSIEISRALQVTAANIRHHLKILRETDMVEVIGVQPGRGRGRPMKVYSLTENAIQHSLEKLSSALLDVLFADSLKTDTILQQVAAALAGDYTHPATAHARLKQAVERLNDLRYHAAWEASPDGPRVILRNCPYTPILQAHLELCALDAALLSILLDAPVQQIARLERSRDGAPHCAFVVR